MGRPDVALLISTFQRPRHLERVLASVAAQRELRYSLEVIVTDDGSTDETLEVVDHFANRSDFPVRYTTHPHDGFQLSRCRNDGVRASSAAYLVFLDGDCLIPPDHLDQHLQRRSKGVVWGGYCYRLDAITSARIDIECVLRGGFLDMAPRSEIRSLNRLARRSQFYSLIGHPSKPRLFGGNIGCWREDYERINGYDEKFVGWGGEDDDFRLRLRQAEIRVRSILPWTRTYHLWHPPVESAPERIAEGRNFSYLNRQKRLTRCRDGLQKLDDTDLRIRIAGDSEELLNAPQLYPCLTKLNVVDDLAEIELATSDASFSGMAEWKILVVTGDEAPRPGTVRAADYVVSNQTHSPLGARQKRPFRLAELNEALREIA